MISNLVFGILIYLVPLLTLVCICMICALLRERRRIRMNNINHHIVSTPSRIINPLDEYENENNSNICPTPHTAKSPSNFDDSLPSYECAINRI
ncbi:unnamed protein product [Rotaria socialis]|uniref:Uncharacterized protein n=1 Tax=Rotaria socialis TaxID=392032 RepID=A0A817PXP1_9BILA|nr:unnamed protein product [Rotaria socialis]CAF3331550.1 unnamed protein product [Rotaria socialis]CAF3555656.1 unnamed protein product [Rotaria socialis]